MLSEPYRQDHSVASFSPMVMCASPGGQYRVGYVLTPHGVVGVYDQHREPFTRLSVVLGGRCYDAPWERSFTDRRLKTLAKRFASEVTAALGPSAKANSGTKTNLKDQSQ